MTEDGELDMAHDDAVKKYLKASIKGVIKTMSKMGISTVASYRGAQIFECIGLNSEVIDQYFTRTTSRVKGIGLGTISREVKLRHHDAYKDRETENDALDAGGIYQWRADGERHLFSPQAIHLLQQSTRMGDMEVFRQYSDLIDEQSKRPLHPAWPDGFQIRPGQHPSRSRKSNRQRDRQTLSRPAPCPTALSPRKPTKRSPLP